MLSGSKTWLLPLAAALTTLCWVTTPVQGHGRMLIPYSRASAWRYGVAGAPVNYNDNENYCGGRSVQHDQNGGQCGICGDNWADPTPRAHERPSGQFVMATNFILTTYTPGQVIEVNIQLTAVHRGYFQFKLCSVDSLGPTQADATQACLDQNQLTVLLTDGSSSDRYPVPDNARNGDKYDVQLQLPAGLTCDFCVLQWKYRTGNSWDAGCLGCGNQEEFYGCSDVSITGSATTPTPPLVYIPEGLVPSELTESDHEFFSCNYCMRMIYGQGLSLDRSDPNRDALYPEVCKNKNFADESKTFPRRCPR